MGFELLGRQPRETHDLTLLISHVMCKDSYECSNYPTHDAGLLTQAGKKNESGNRTAKPACGPPLLYPLFILSLTKF